MPDVQITQLPEIVVTKDSAPSVDLTQAGEILVTTDTAPLVDLTQVPQVFVTRQPADAQFTQLARVVVTKTFVPGNQRSCRVSVSC